VDPVPTIFACCDQTRVDGLRVKTHVAPRPLLSLMPPTAITLPLAENAMRCKPAVDPVTPDGNSFTSLALFATKAPRLFVLLTCVDVFVVYANVMIGTLGLSITTPPVPKSISAPNPSWYSKRTIISWLLAEGAANEHNV